MVQGWRQKLTGVIIGHDRILLHPLLKRVERKACYAAAER